MSEFTSNRDSDPREPLDPEDDWFASVADEPAGPEEPVWQDEPAAEPSEPLPPGLGRRQIAVVLAVLVAVAVAGVVIVGIRALGGDSGGGAGTTAVTTTQEPAGATTGTTPTTPTETGGTTTPATTTPDTTTDTVPTGATLRPGDSGDSVTALQQALQALGFDPGTVDGKYGAATEQAVTAFQQSKDLAADGIAGPKTIAAINAALASG